MSELNASQLEAVRNALREGLGIDDTSLPMLSDTGLPIPSEAPVTMAEIGRGVLVAAGVLFRTVALPFGGFFKNLFLSLAKKIIAKLGELAKTLTVEEVTVILVGLGIPPWWAALIAEGVIWGIQYILKQQAEPPPAPVS